MQYHMTLPGSSMQDVLDAPEGDVFFVDGRGEGQGSLRAGCAYSSSSQRSAEISCLWLFGLRAHVLLYVTTSTAMRVNMLQCHHRTFVHQCQMIKEYPT